MRVMAASRRDAASYYRILCPFSILKYRGLPVTIGRPSIQEIEDYDVLWLQQHADAETEVLARAYKEAGKKIVYDVDDWLFDIPPSWPSYDFFFARGSGNAKNPIGFYERLLRMADVVTTTTPYLAQKIRARFPGADVRVLPNYILAGDWDTIEPVKHHLDGPVLGWFGTGTHWDDWVEIAQIVDRALEAVGGYLAMIGAPEIMACFPERLRKRTQIHPLMTIDQMNMVRLLISPCDVGLSWVSNRLEAGLCRSPLKALQWGAAGVPLVASRTVYEQIPGADELFTLSDLNNLETNLRSVLSRPLQDRPGSARDWRDAIFLEYTYETHSHRWIDVIESLTPH